MTGVSNARKGGLALLLLVALAACGGRGDDGTPKPPPPVPTLTGYTVMLLPPRPGDPPELEDALVAELTRRSPGIDWILPERIRATVERNRASGFDLSAPRTLQNFGGSNIRVEDPLYGDLRRMGALLDAPVAVVPITTRRWSDSTGTGLALETAVISVRGGQVLWHHTVRGGPGEGGDEATAAAASLARILFPEDG